MPRPDLDREIHITTTDARAGSKDNVVRWVLMISLSLAVIVMTAIWLTGAYNAPEAVDEASGRAPGQETPQNNDIDGARLSRSHAAGAAHG